jgi:hypothetical protein
MTDFIAAEDRALLEQHGLADFEALWALKLDAVDEPNTGRGGWSSVYRLELGERAFYLKRQANYLTHTLARPLGEPTLARELRNIQRFERLGVPCLKASFFAQRRVAGERRAVLLTQALDGWEDLQHSLDRWQEIDAPSRQAMVLATGRLLRRLHQARQLCGCFYPKHVFLRASSNGFDSRLIDLEKARPLLFGTWDRVKDLETLLRRAGQWAPEQVQLFLQTYLEQPAGSATVAAWTQRLEQRRRHKDRH